MQPLQLRSSRPPTSAPSRVSRAVTVNILHSPCRGNRCQPSRRPLPRRHAPHFVTIPTGVPKGVPSAVARAGDARNLRLPSRQPCSESCALQTVGGWAHSVRAAPTWVIQPHDSFPGVSASGYGVSWASGSPFAAPQRPPRLEPQKSLDLGCVQSVRGAAAGALGSHAPLRVVEDTGSCVSHAPGQRGAPPSHAPMSRDQGF
jgi:hypothetical protein